jgi:hypothetical protein
MTIDNIGDFLLHPLVKRLAIKDAIENDFMQQSREIFTITPIRIIAFLVFLAAIKKDQRDELIKKVISEYSQDDFEKLVGECDWIAIFDDIKGSGLLLKIKAHQRTEFNRSLELNGFYRLSQALSVHDSFAIITDNDNNTDLSVSVNTNISVKFPKWQLDDNNHLNLEAKTGNNHTFWPRIKIYSDDNNDELLILNDEIETKKDKVSVIMENYLGPLINFKAKVSERQISLGLYKNLVGQGLSAGYCLETIVPTIAATAICDKFSQRRVTSHIDSRSDEQIIVLRKDFTLLYPSGVSLRFAINTNNEQKKDSSSSFRIGDLEIREGNDITFFVGRLTNLEACKSFLKNIERQSAKRCEEISLAEVVGAESIPHTSSSDRHPVPILQITAVKGLHNPDCTAISYQ